VSNADNEKIEQKCRNLIGALLEPEDSFIDIYEQIIAFCNGLEKKYKEKIFDCGLYHVLAGSTMIKGSEYFLDFSGEDSIEAFIDQLAQKYCPEQYQKIK